MKVAVKTDLRSKTFSICKTHTCLTEKEIRLVSHKFYQKLFVIIMSFSTILIFPESPKEMGNMCENYNSRKACSVW